jgi:hypothetical protein|tara:strand:+ start:4802 stop:5146 length:345 start_codon:yes stop_codon:yes gene_type:complete
LEKVLILVGETALSVSSRRLAPLPKLRGVEVLTESLGRCETGPRGIIGSEVVMVGAGAGDGAYEGGIECDMAVSIMCGCRGADDGWAWCVVVCAGEERDQVEIAAAGRAEMVYK